MFDNILNMSPSDLSALKATQLMAMKGELDAAASHVSKASAVLHTELHRRYAAGLNKHGTTRLHDDGVEACVTLPKRVKWDQAELAKAVETIKSWGERPEDYVEIEIKVSETKYSAWPPAIASIFEPARTIETGKAKIELNSAKKEAS